MNDSALKLPLFPLHTVVFPGGPLPLRIFEPRYLDMVSRCLREGSGFGICLIRDGEEVGGAALTYEIGTLVRISDWHQREDGLLGLDVMGERRFRIQEREIRRDHLIIARVMLLPEEPAVPLPGQYRSMAELLGRIIEQVGKPYRDLRQELDNATWVGHRLAELLPMAFVQRQYLLELNDPLLRLKNLEDVLKALDIPY